MGEIFYLVCIRQFRDDISNHFASLLFCFLQATAADSLSKFYYPPVASVTVSYPKDAIRTECLIDGELKGFGQLHPRSQGVETLGECSMVLVTVVVL